MKQHGEYVGRRTLLTAAVLLSWPAALGCGFQPARAGPSQQDQDAPGEPAAARPDLPLTRPVASDEEVLAGIQETLNRQAAARAAVDRAAYMATIDQRNLTWRRIQGDVFSRVEAAGHHPADTYTVTRVQPKQNGYYKAAIDIAPAGSSRVQSQAVWVFRPTEHAWLHSEILNEELGPRQTTETEHFTLAYFAWDEDVIDRIAAAAERAYRRVVEQLGTAPEFRSVLSVNPTYGAHSGLRGGSSLAAYLPATKNMIIIRSIESFGAGYTSPDETQDGHLLTTLTHEYTHLVNDQLVPLVKMREWMSEGLAEYVAENLREPVVAHALRAGKAISLDQASQIIEWWTDPVKGYTDSDRQLAYAESALAVAYFMERFKQITFFDLAREFAETRRWEESFAGVTGVTWAQFESSWLTWVRQRLNA